ncbi:MAG: spermidine/putrescine transport system substrate-binding protein [Desulfomicrobiaceae bacterium]|jgi:spermidine/putrescine transport system substrate-binding protein|nr:spermidine/putrescine transport system substrate-binding protein [Desulfomicrobiaceae bacterium]MDK2872950.1 spermidine/putrescine transport system substrate-binding protein [Desulfomicrobiaceae bacterium]HCF04885.1 spermidine/putrescine ABC transporter substrate-binding protein [Desulfomicrobiaceae bacterium]
MKKKLVFALLALFCLAGVAQAQETLKLLTWKGYAPQNLVDKFEKETGIKVEVTYSNNEEMIAKLRATRGAGFDLAQPSQDRIASVQEQFGIYQPIDYTKIQSDLFIPSMLEAVKKNTQVGGKSYAVPFCWGTSGLVVNTAQAGGTTSWKALIDPQYKGRISYRLKRPVLIGLGFALGYDPFALYGDEKAYGEMLDKIEAELIKAKPLVKNYWANGDQLLESVRSGEVTVAEGWDNGGWKLHEENKDIDFVAPSEGALGWIDTFAIPAKAKNVDAAYKWINFMLRPENSGAFTSAEKIPTASKGAGPFIDPAFQANFDRSFPQAVIDNIKWYPPVPAKLEAMEGKVLDRIKAAN